MATTTPRWPAEHEHGHPNIVLAALALASLMSVMDLFIVNAALHTIGRIYTVPCLTSRGC